MEYSAEFKNKKVVILDYQLGNLFSVKQACDVVGMHSKVSSDKNEIADADAIILPGVGAFKEAMYNLKDLDIIEPLKDFVGSGKPLFGICLGLQLLFTESEEFGTNGGLNFISGSIKKFTNAPTLNINAKVPHIGWNTIKDSNNAFVKTPLKDISNNEFMYFVHSYFVECNNQNDVLGTTHYGQDFVSAFQHDNIIGMQFHPEKSHQFGMELLKNFTKL